MAFGTPYSIGTIATKASTTEVITTNASVVAGNTIFVWFYTNNATTTPTVVDSNSNTYTQLTFQAGPGAVGRVYIYVCYASKGLNTSSTITVTVGTNSGYFATAWAVSGVLSTHFVNTATGAGTSTAPTASLTGLTSTATYLAFGTVTINGPNGDTFTQATGYAAPPTNIGSTGGNQTTNYSARGGYDNFTGATSKAYAPTLGTSRAWREILVVYKQGNDFSDTITESGTSNESSDESVAFLGIQSESTSSGETSTSNAEFNNINLTESATADSTTTNTADLLVSSAESTTAGESSTRGIDVFVSETETQTFSESSSYTWETSSDRTETISGTESSSYTWDTSASRTETGNSQSVEETTAIFVVDRTESTTSSTTQEISYVAEGLRTESSTSDESSSSVFVTDTSTSESVSSQEVITQTSAQNFPISETVIVSESSSLLVDFVSSTTEQITGSDSQSSVFVTDVSRTESTTAEESSSRTFVTPVLLTETIVGDETSSEYISFDSQTLETLSGDDTSTQTYDANVTIEELHTIGEEDIHAYTLSYAGEFIYEFTTVDDYSECGILHFEFWDESQTLSEVSTSTKAVTGAVNDILSGNEQSSSKAIFVSVISETVDGNESNIANIRAVSNITETISTIDVSQSSLSAVGSLIESCIASENIGNKIVFVASVAEQSSVNDLIDVIRQTYALIENTLSVEDSSDGIRAVSGSATESEESSDLIYASIIANTNQQEVLAAIEHSLAGFATSLSHSETADANVVVNRFVVLILDVEDLIIRSSSFSMVDPAIYFNDVDVLYDLTKPSYINAIVTVSYDSIYASDIDLIYENGQVRSVASGQVYQQL